MASELIVFRGCVRERAEVEQIWTDALDASLRDLRPEIAARVQQTLADCEDALSTDNRGDSA